MNKQIFYRQKYKTQNPKWQNSEELYKNKILSFIHNNQTKILDIGCGHGELLNDVFEKTSESYGIDPDASAIEKNKIIKHKYVGSAENLPFENDFFDVVTCAWVLEHLENPQKVFAEISRVLKPGGKFLFITPNIYNYNVWIIRMIPQKFHEFFTKRLYQRQDNDTFYKFYLANSHASINQLLSNENLNEYEFILNGDPSYISFNEILFWISCKIENIIDKYFSGAKVHIIGIYEKN